MSKVWFITGGGRGMGTDIARAALDAGYKRLGSKWVNDGFLTSDSKSEM